MNGQVVPVPCSNDVTGVVGRGAEADCAVHLLGEPNSPGVFTNSATSGAGPEAFVEHSPRGANAAIVSDGFAPTGPGITAPSATCRPGTPCTLPPFVDDAPRHVRAHRATAERSEP